MAKATNILFLMADQLAPHALPFHGHHLVKARHLESIAARGTVFDNAQWDYQPFEDATRLYYRGDGGDWHAA